MGKPADYELWPRKADVWVLKDLKTFQAWLKHWRTKYGIGDADYKLFNEGGAFSGDLVLANAKDRVEDMRNHLVHCTGHFTVRAFSRGVPHTPAWLTEAWGHYCEHAKLGQGHVACSQRAQYGGAGGIADKGKFSTKDAKDRCRGIIREGTAEPMANLSKLDLNSLNGDHLAKGWSVVEWLMSTRKAQFIAWLEAMNKMAQEEALGSAIDGWNFAKLDEEWEAYVKAKY
jgi:hypothetical protein